MMRRWLGWIAIGWMLVLSIATVAIYGTATSPPTLESRTRALAAQFRCPICHGESVADSESGIARSIRSLIHRRLAQGESSEQIKRYLVSRYGTVIVLAPPMSGIGSLAWIAPPLLLLAGLGLLATLFAAWRRQDALPRGRRAEYVERVRVELTPEVGRDGPDGREVPV